jgi:hypothetical protein
MKFTPIIIATIVMMTSTIAKSTIISFDGADKLGGPPILGTGGTTSGTDVFGQTLEFTNFDVRAGHSTTLNLGVSNFSISQITFNPSTAGVYQSIDPGHGGLGAETMGGANDVNMFQPNLDGTAFTDEVIFFDFDSSLILDVVYFNGNHEEQTMQDAWYNIFKSSDGVNYQKLFNHKAPTGREYMLTNLTTPYQYYAVAATGTGQNRKGFIEAIGGDEISVQVPAPSIIVLLGFGLVSLGYSRKQRCSNDKTEL